MLGLMQLLDIKLKDNKSYTDYIPHLVDVNTYLQKYQLSKTSLYLSSIT